MLNILKIDNYLKILTDEEVKDFVVISLSEYFKFSGEKLHSKLTEETNFRKLMNFWQHLVKYSKIMQSKSSDKYAHRYSIEILNLFNVEIQLMNTKPMIKSKLK